MKSSKFSLNEAREILISTPSKSQKKSNRRQFLRAIGLGTIAVTPTIGAVKNLTSDPFKIESEDDKLRVWRHGQLAWEISPDLFENETQISFEQKDANWEFFISNLTFKGTNLTYNLHGSINHTLTQWLINLEIPDFEWKAEMDFLDFLDGVKPLTSNAKINHEILHVEKNGSVFAQGVIQTSLYADWKLELKKEKSIHFQLFEKNYSTDSLHIIPGVKDSFNFYETEINGSLLQFPDFSDWENFITSYKYRRKSLFSNPEGNPTLQLISGKTENEEVKMLFSNASEKNIFTKTSLKENIKIEDYFFFQQFSEENTPLYFSGRIAQKGQWISNPIGSFNLGRNDKTPDFEVFGLGYTLHQQSFKPLLKAFHPKVTAGITSTTSYKNPSVIQILSSDKNDLDIKSQYFYEPPQDTTRKKTIIKGRTVTPVKTETKEKVILPEKKEEVKIDKTKDLQIEKTPEIQVQNSNKIKYIPRLPMSIRILRPDDLIWLDLEFKNFKFVNRGRATMVELDNSSKPGTITYSFPTQHTLEEAFFESTPMDTDGNETVKLPARHIRAKKSRLVYEYDAGKPAFELSIQELLDWSKFNLKVHPRAYIKLPNVVLKPVEKPITSPKAELLNTQNLNTKNNFYKTQIVQKSRNKADNLSVYDKPVVYSVLPDKITPTLEPNYNLAGLVQSLKVQPIDDAFTSIEAPALMYISPNQVNDFSHKIDLEYQESEEKPVVKSNSNVKQLRPVRQVQINSLYTNKGQITELWHTSLGVKLKNNRVASDGFDKLKTIRALWAFDANEDYKGCATIDNPFPASLDASDRHKLVHTTSNYLIQGFTPIPVPVKKLMLTGLGAYLDWHAYFDVPSPVDTHLNVIEWEHLATLGRDHYVKIVREGYLFPLGHRAALVKVTERKFDVSTKAAVNKMRMYIVILEKEVLYNRTDPANQFIKFPFQAVRIENDYTPNINKPENINLGGLNVVSLTKSTGCPQKKGRSSTYNFYINVNSKPFLFDITATDKEGVEQSLQMPLAFVENVTGRTKSMVEKMVSDYNPKKALNEIAFKGQQVAFSESLVDGDTAFETKSILFGAQYYPANGVADLKFHPNIQSAAIYIKAVDELTGKHEPATIELEDDKNDGMVFAKLSGLNVDFSNGSDKSGGFISPNMSISGLSKLQGPIGGKIEDMKSLNFVPTEFFKVLDNLPMGKIFGAIDLISLLLDKPNIGNDLKSLANKLKQFKTEIEKLKDDILIAQQQVKEGEEAAKTVITQKKQALKQKADELLETLNKQTPKIPNLKTWFTTEAFYAEYKWIPEFSSGDIGLFGDLLKFKVAKPKEALQITTTMTKYLDGLSVPKLDTKAELNSFSIEIKDALIVNFNSMKFITGSTQKSDVKVDMDKTKPIEFVGALSFVNNLQSLIPSTGFSDDGPYVNLTAQGVRAGFNLSVPDVEVGVFSITNMTLGAYVDLPFTGGELTMGFNFCTRENPFLLTVSGFGGGGYFLMITSLRGIKSVEAAFEFGASASLNLGVASGGVTIMGGFYFKYEIVDELEKINLSGYIRINGRMSVLGLISVSLEFYLALNAVYETVMIGNSEQMKVTKMEGVATLKVKIEILFFSKTVSVSVRREFAGADADPTFAEMVLAEDWNEYCLAFA